MSFNLPPEAHDTVIHYAVIGAVFGFIKAALSRYKRKVIRYVLTAAISIPVAVIAGFIAQDFFPNSPGLIYAATAVSALLAENIIVALMVWGQKFEKDPLKTIKETKQVFNNQEQDDAK